MRGRYFNAEVSAWTQTDWGEPTLFNLGGGGELYLLTPSLRECQGAFRQWPLTFYWFHHMLRRTGNWLLTNCVSAANRMVTNQNGGGVGANDAAWQEDNSVLWQYWRVALLYIITHCWQCFTLKSNYKCSVKIAWQEEAIYFFPLTENKHRLKANKGMKCTSLLRKVC